MIVEPDFLDHWKTRLLIELTQNPAAPLMILRLWAHCQHRKKWKFDLLDNDSLRAICHATMDGTQLLIVLTKARFVEKIGALLVVHDWEKANRSLISAWKNGSKGGRPLKLPQNRQDTDRKPTANRQLTRPSIYLSSLSLLSESVQNRFKEWVVVRKAMGKAPKNWDGMFSEQITWIGQFPPPDQIEILSASIRNNWQGLFPPKTNHNGANHRHTAESGRGLGTANEGKSAQYKGVGKIQGVSNHG